jgi:hypothetical protein
MSRTLYDRLDALASRRVAALLMVVFMVLSIAVFPPVIRRLNTLAGQELGLIDAQFSYSPQQVYQMEAAYGPEGRPLYILTTLIADTLFPLDYALLMGIFIVLTYRVAFPAFGLVRTLVWLPVVTALMDLLENTGIMLLLATFPQQVSLLAQATSFFTSLKWIFLSLSLVLVVAGVIGWLVARFKK